MSKKECWIKPSLLAVLLYAVLPNLLFWLISKKIGFDRPVFNLDYLLVGVVFALGWRVVAVILLGFFLVGDILVVTSFVYPFVRLQDVAYLLSLLPYAAPVWQIAAAGGVLAVIAVMVISYRYGVKVNRLAALVLFNIGIVAYGANVYADEVELERWYRGPKDTLVGSQALFFHETRMGGFVATANASGEPLQKIGFHGATAIWNDTVEPLNKKLLLVVVESWGVMKDKLIQQALLAPLAARQEQFNYFKVTKIEGSMATVAAELRELCGLHTEHFNLKPVTQGFENCLPWKLKSQGYGTAAIHGAVGIMYDRVHWYPRAGFDKVRFKETEAWETRCYSFPGACDREILDKYIAHAFEGDEKQFIYWLTLNTHAIYDSRDIYRDTFDCQLYQLEEGSETCRMTKLHAQFFHQLAEVLTSPSMRGVEVLLVGDHHPRILNQGEKETNIEGGLVTQVHLRVKN